MKSFVPSPLFVWKLLLITAIAATIALTQIDPVLVHIQQRQKELPKKIEKSRKEKKTADIVFFGDSLMQAATPPTEAEINSILSKILNRPVRAVNLSIDGRSALDLDRRADQILRLNPRIVVLQPEMVVGRMANPKQQRSFLEKEKQRLKDWINFAKAPLIKRFIAGGSSKKREELINALASPAQVDIAILKDSNQETENDIFLRTLREHWTGQIISKRAPEYNYCRNFIEKALANGSKVIIVETPISETASKYATAQYLQQRKEVILKLLGDDQNLYLSYPKLLPDNFFYDYVHVNRKGQKAFFKWLAIEISKNFPEAE
jgi:lysophospholipase L1-like esterase